MKNYVIILICVLVSGMAWGQNKSKNLMGVKVTPPKFTGIEEIVTLKTEANSIGNYLATHFDIFDKHHSYEGTEVVQFSVTPKGDIENFKIINSVSPQIDEEIIRILKKTNGMWKPGLNNGIPVAMVKDVALEIRPNDDDGLPVNTDYMEKAQYYFAKGSKNFFIKKNFKKALKNYDNGMCYKPYDKSLRLLRGLCRYELGYIEEAHQDWELLRELGGTDMADKLADYDLKSLKGYKEYIAMFSENEK